MYLKSLKLEWSKLLRMHDPCLVAAICSRMCILRRVQTTMISHINSATRPRFYHGVEVVGRLAAAAPSPKLPSLDSRRLVAEAAKLEGSLLELGLQPGLSNIKAEHAQHLPHHVPLAQCATI